MSLGELQDCSCVARGCVIRSVFVFSLYLSKAWTNIVRKLDVLDVGVTWDIATGWQQPGIQVGYSETDERETAKRSRQKGHWRRALTWKMIRYSSVRTRSALQLQVQLGLVHARAPYLM